MTSIRISPRHGLNPTIPVCFWCGRDKNEIVFMGYIRDKTGNDIAAPMHMVIDYEPCQQCYENMKRGVTLIEATREPNAVTSVELQQNVYPTGRYAVIERCAADRAFNGFSGIEEVFVEPELFERLISCD